MKIIFCYPERHFFSDPSTNSAQITPDSFSSARRSGVRPNLPQ